MIELTDYGWDESRAKDWQLFATTRLVPARVTSDFGTSLKIVLPEERTAELSGKLAHYAGDELTPKVGDWVAVHMFDNSPPVIEAVMPRRSEIARKAAGNRTVKQVIAANVDLAFVLLALDNDFSIERLQRFLYQLSISNVDPVIVLNKADKTDDAAAYIEQLETFKLPIVLSIATAGTGTDEIMQFIKPGQTAMLLGSSGVGKSTLTNRLLGHEAQSTQEVRASDSTGKHTTVHRELFRLPNGGLLIDNPGVREFQLWGTQEELDEDFGDIAALGRQCKYSTCGHTTEPGCAIRQAIANGSLDEAHYVRYQTMKTELAGLKQKHIELRQRDNRKTKQVKRRQAEDSLADTREDLL